MRLCYTVRPPPELTDPLETDHRPVLGYALGWHLVQPLNGRMVNLGLPRSHHHESHMIPTHRIQHSHRTRVDQPVSGTRHQPDLTVRTHCRA